MATVNKYLECIICGKEAERATMRGKICLPCRTAAALKKSSVSEIDVEADSQARPKDEDRKDYTESG